MIGGSDSALGRAVAAAWAERRVLAGAHLAGLFARAGWLGIAALASAILARATSGSAAVADLAVPLAFLGGGLVVIAGLRCAADYFGIVGSERAIASMYEALHRRLHRARLDAVVEKPVGELASLYENDLSVVTYFATDSLPAALPNAVVAVSALVLIVAIDPLFAVATVIGGLPLLVTARLAGRRIRPRSIRSSEQRAALSGLTHEQLQQLETTRAAAAGARELELYRDQLGATLKAVLGQQRAFLAVRGTLAAAVAVVAVLLLGLGIQRVGAGAVTGEELFALAGFAVVGLGPLLAVADLYGNWQAVRGANARLRDAWTAPPDPALSGTRAVTGPGAVSFDGVQFRYPGGPPLLRGVDLEVAPGEVVALQGENGAGKTTLLHLLLRFYDVDAGMISIDGVDLRAVSGDDLRRTVGFVSQRSGLWARSVRENLLFAAPDASEEEIRRAVDVARLGSVLEDLPDGMESPIGPGGVRLSAGECQRLALARALVARPRILLLDEPTAMFDGAAEAEFVQSLREFSAGTTILLVTHRPMLLSIADRTIHLSDGRVAAGRFPAAAPVEALG